MSENHTEDFTRYKPQHPLPASIREMPRDETVCQYCGVSYLIHNELKALEEMLANAQKEILHLKGGTQREEQLLQQLDQSQQALQLAMEENRQKDNHISDLQIIIRSSEEKLQVIQQGQDDMNKTAKILRKDNMVLHDHLCRTSSCLKTHRTEISTLRDEVLCQKEQNCEFVKCLSVEILQTLQKYDKKLENEVQNLTFQNRQLSMEAQQFKEQLKNKTKEMEELVTQSQKIYHLESSLEQLSQELKVKTTNLAACREQLEEKKARFEEQNVKEEENRSRTAACFEENRELKLTLTQVQGDIKALKEERELMIISHQNRMEQLRESFKKKLAEAEHWPDKMKEILQLEKNKHQAEITAFSHKLKEDFVTELQVEKEKYDTLMAKYQVELNTKESEIAQYKHNLQSERERELSRVKIKYDSDMKILQDELSRAKDRELDLKKETHSLKSIISNLEERLGHLREESVVDTQKLKESLQNACLELDEAYSSLKSAEKKLAESKEEIVFLQETVRSECEERFELTGALNEMQKELSSLQMPTGVSAPLDRSKLQVYHNDYAESDTSPTITSQPSLIVKMSSNDGISTSIGLQHGSSKPSSGTIAENRRRIASILGKK